MSALGDQHGPGRTTVTPGGGGPEVPQTAPSGSGPFLLTLEKKGVVAAVPEPICTCPDLETTMRSYVETIEIPPCALHDLGEVAEPAPPVLSITRAEAREAASDLIRDLSEHYRHRQPVVDLLVDTVLREGIRTAGAIALVALEIVFAECLTPVSPTERTTDHD